MDTPDRPDLPEKRMVNYEESFLREADKGVAAADRGKLMEHFEVRKLIDERYPG